MVGSVMAIATIVASRPKLRRSVIAVLLQRGSIRIVLSSPNFRLLRIASDFVECTMIVVSKAIENISIFQALGWSSPAKIWILFTLFGLISCGGSDPAPPDLGLDQIMMIEDPRNRADQLGAYLDGVTLRQLPEIADVLDQNHARIDAATGISVALWWVQQDPTSAMNEGLTHHWIEGPLWASTVIREWARLAPEQALGAASEALATQGGPNWHRTITIALVRGWFDEADRSPDQLIAFIGGLPPGRAQKEPLDVLFNQMISSQETEKAIALVEGMLEHDSIGRNAMKMDAFHRLATQLAARDPQRAIEWADGHRGGPYGAGLYTRIARRWARHDPAAAAAWAETLPENGTKHDQILKAILRGWNSTDRQSAAEWVDSKPIEGNRTELFHMSAVHQARHGAPALAAARVERLASGELREEVLVGVGRAWLQSDPEGAEKWLGEIELSAAARAEMRKPLRGRESPKARPVPNSS